MPYMRLNEVAYYLGKSTAQVRRYIDAGELTMHHKEHGKVYFAREDVENLARVRRIRTVESEVPQGTNFIGQMSLEQWVELATKILPPGTTLTLRKEPEPIAGKA